MLRVVLDVELGEPSFLEPGDRLLVLVWEKRCSSCVRDMSMVQLLGKVLSLATRLALSFTHPFLCSARLVIRHRFRRKSNSSSVLF